MEIIRSKVVAITREGRIFVFLIYKFFRDHLFIFYSSAKYFKARWAMIGHIIRKKQLQAINRMKLMLNFSASVMPWLV